MRSSTTVDGSALDEPKHMSRTHGADDELASTRKFGSERAQSGGGMQLKGVGSFRQSSTDGDTAEEISVQDITENLECIDDTVSVCLALPEGMKSIDRYA